MYSSNPKPLLTGKLLQRAMSKIKMVMAPPSRQHHKEALLPKIPLLPMASLFSQLNDTKNLRLHL